MGIKHIPTSVHSPQRDGIGERINLPITSILRLHREQKIEVALKK